MKKISYNKLLDQVEVSQLDQFFAMVSELEDVVSLGVGEPDFDTPWIIRAEAISNIEKGNTFYTTSSGFLALREEISYYLKRRFKLDYKFESEIICTVGGSEAIDVVMRTFLNHGDEVLVLEPSYIAYKPCIKLAGGVVVNVPLQEKNNFRVTPQDLKDKITPKTKMIIMNFPSNPTGAVMNEADYQALREIIIENDLLVVSDEIYAELNYVGQHVSPANIAELRDNVILISGFSKAYSMTGWRLGYICAKEELMQHIRKVHQYNVMSAPTISQYAGIVAMRRCDDIVQEMVESFHQRRNFIVKGFNEMGISCRMPEGAFYVFCNISQFGLSSQEFCERLLKEAKIAVIPGSAFGEAGEGFIRCSYAYSIDEIKIALKRIESFIQKLS